jgi:predicted DNA-binding transcriptional regulator AlpA
MQSPETKSRRLIPDPQVWKRYGVTSMTGWRWDNNPNLQFPKPVVINRRKYRYEDELEQWERAQAAKSNSAPEAA